jgi:hypothetical protein
MSCTAQFELSDVRGRDMGKGIIYEAHEVIELWQRWENRHAQGHVSRDTLARPGQRQDPVNINLRGWQHVEGFLCRHLDLAYVRDVWRLGQHHEKAEAVFSEWYRSHPLSRLLSFEADRKPDNRFEPITLKQAAGYLGCTEQALRLAASPGGGLHAWKPKGEGWLTNIQSLDEYRENHPVGRPKKGK